jgi:phosphoethanolamine N-methyltransferase
MDRLITNRAEFLATFSETDLNYLVERWQMKVRFCRCGDMKWGNFLASRGS